MINEKKITKQKEKIIEKTIVLGIIWLFDFRTSKVSFLSLITISSSSIILFISSFI